MRISRIRAFQVELPMREGSYSWSTQSHSAFDSTVVLIDTDEGVSGVGESCPLGPTYLAAYAEGVRAGIDKIAPGLIGEDPTQLERINRRMDDLMKGHPYVKSAIDMACWDILGKCTELPVYHLLGGKLQERIKLFKVVTRTDPDVMADRVAEYREAGFDQFQVKVGEDPHSDIIRFHKVAAAMQPGEVMDADANTGWRQHDALMVVDAVRGLVREHGISIYIEQPCPSYEECLAVRQHTDLPFILDECMDGLPILLRGYQDRAMDLINLKINRMGGLTRARQVRDLCISLGIVMTIEDSWGGEVATAAIAHLAQSTPQAFHFQSSAFHEYATISIAEGAPTVSNGYMIASDRPGLGVTPLMDALGKAIVDTR
ncbi:MAG: cis-3-hydroxy-L-proline dehydratase [Pseudomonadota bacterium]|nr:cis-3-hydroxy-L-proline dehydratase [Pseudomonadota bacterium]